MTRIDRSSWGRVRFGDVVTNTKETVKDPVAEGLERIVALEHMQPGNLQLSGWQDAADGTTFTRRFRADQTLFAKRRAYQRKVAYAKFDGVCSGDILVFEAKPSALLPELLPFVVQSDAFFEHALRTSAGSLSPRTKWQDLATWEFDLPPLAEQKRIADLLWALEREQLVLNREAAALLGARSSYLPAKMAHLSVQQTAVGDLAKVLRDGPFGSKIKSDHYVQADGVRVLRLQNLGVGRVDTTDEAMLDATHVAKELAGHRVRSGDLLVAGLGDDANPVGRASSVPKMLDGAVHKSDVFRLVPDDARVDRRFLVELLNSPVVRSQVLSLAQGGTRLRINTTNFRKVILPLPSLAEQARIVDAVELFETAGDRLARRLVESRRLRERLMTEVLG